MIDAPNTDVSFGQYENNDTAFLWYESTQTINEQFVSLLVSDLAAGEQTRTSPGPSGTLGAGTYSSYMLHMEADVSTGGNQEYFGSITFSQEIVGLIYNRFENCASHDVFGAPGTTYPGAGYPSPGVTCDEKQNFDFGSGVRNFIALSADRKTLEFNQFTPHDLDQIRVLTAVPVPAAVWLFGSGLGLLGWMRRRGGAKA